ncbi:MAG: hydroxypyruvate isomerase family protein [Candidatus Caldatribacteriota bacterium]
MRYSLCIDSLYPEEGLKEKITQIKNSKFKFIEFWDWRNKDLDLIVNSGLKVSNFSGNRITSLVLDEEDKVLQEFYSSLEVAKKLNCPHIMLLSDILKSDGNVELNTISKEEKRLRLLKNLKEIIKIAEKERVLILLEPLNTLKDHNNYFLDSFSSALNIVREVNSEYLKILYDIYHMQIMEGNIVETIWKYYPFIGYVHLANVPYRGEPWVGELDLKFILKELHKVYSGFVGFEFFVREKDFSYEKLLRWIQSINFTE